MGERLRILELIESGEISVEEGARRLEATAEVDETSKSTVAPTAPIAHPALVRWLWQGVSWAGVGLATGGGLLLTAVYAGEIAARWATWGWMLFVLGMLGLALGWWLRRANWLSVRVRQPDGPNVFIALPLPLGLVALGLRIARPFVPQLEGTGVDELLLALRDEMKDGQPILVEVNEGEGREQIQVYFG